MTETTSHDLPSPDEDSNLISTTIDDSPKPDIIENLLSRIGTGTYHYISYAIIGACWLADGAEIIALSLLNYIIVKVIWFRSMEDVASLGSSLFFGFFIGSLISGMISDNYGRKGPFVFYAALMFCSSVLSAFSQSFEFLMITRSIYGMSLGLMSPVSASYLIEITPINARGKNYIIVSSLFSIGELIAVGLAVWLDVANPEKETWRALLIWCAVPALLCGVGGFIYMKESPRFALSKSTDEAVTVLEEMHEKNHGAKMGITEREKQEIEEWRNANIHHEKKESIWTISHLFKGRNSKVTPFLWVSWWVLSFSYYGMTYVLPLVLSKIGKGEDEEESLDFHDLAVSVLGEIPSYILLYYIIELKMFGRRKSLIWTFGLGALCYFGAYYWAEKHFLFFIFLAKFFVNSAFGLIYPFTSELYSTSHRATGLGCCSAASRIGGMVMPWITIYALKSSVTAPFLIFGVSCCLAAISCALIPYDTTGVPLDQEHFVNKEEKGTKYT